MHGGGGLGEQQPQMTMTSPGVAPEVISSQ